MRADGSNVQRFGGNPKGINVFDANGRFFVMFARPDLPKIASRDPLKTTTEENKAVMEGTIAYYGTYSVSKSDKVLTLRVEASSFPNQVGADQKRTITELTGDQLKYENTTVLSGGQIRRGPKPTEVRRSGCPVWGAYGGGRISLTLAAKYFTGFLGQSCSKVARRPARIHSGQKRWKIWKLSALQSQ